MLAVAWGFAGIEGELRLRDQGLAFNDADIALDTASASRSHLGEAVRVAAYGSSLGEDEAGRVAELALSLADESLREFDLRSDVVLARENDLALDRAAHRYLVAAVGTIESLRLGDVAAADARFTADVAPSYSDLSGQLAAIRAQSLATFTSGSGVNYFVSLVTRFLLAVAVPIGAIIVIFDAMRRRQRHRELQLELTTERDFVKTKDEFIANVSHELRTPLTIIQGFATVIEEDEALPEHLGDSAMFISREAGELTRLVEDLLTAARTDAGALVIKPEHFPVHKAIENVVLATDENNRITYALESAAAYTDPVRLRQIVRNLLSNALKHGGPQIHVSGVVDAGDYVITVSDNGEGVPAEIEDHLFERFVHGSGDRLLAGSVGLGLAIVKSLVERMDMTITYERIAGETYFTLRLPLPPSGFDVHMGSVIRLESAETAETNA